MDIMTADEKKKILKKFARNERDGSYYLSEYTFARSYVRGGKKQEYSLYGVYDEKTNKVKIFMKGHVDPMFFSQKEYNIARECNDKFMYLGSVSLDKFNEFTRSNVLKSLVGSSKEDVDRLLKVYHGSVKSYVHDNLFSQSIKNYRRAFDKCFRVIDDKIVYVRTAAFRKAEKEKANETAIYFNQPHMEEHRSKLLEKNISRASEKIKLARDKAKLKYKDKSKSSPDIHI